MCSWWSRRYIARRQRSGTFTWCPARRCSLRTQILESGSTHPACAMGGAQPPFSTTGAAQPVLLLRLLLLRAGDVEVNPGPVCSGCTGTIRVGSHPIICTQCQRLFHEYCNGLTRDRQKSPQGYVCGACGSTNGSTIQPWQITRSQPNNTFFCQTNIAVSNHPCSRFPQQTSIPLQRRSTVNPNTEPTTPDEPPRATTVRKCSECKRCLAHVRSPIVCVACRQQFHVKCARETLLALQRLRAADAWTCHICAEGNQPAAVDRKTDMPEQNKHCLTILQWNCDCLTTKAVELNELTVRYGIDIIALQETKLGRDDPTPILNGFDAVRRDRPGSGARFARGGGLLTYIKKGIPYSEDPAAYLPAGNTSPSLMYTSHQYHRTTFNLWKIVKPGWML